MKKPTAHELMSKAYCYRFIFILLKSQAGKYMKDEKVLKPYIKYSKETKAARSGYTFICMQAGVL
jgi:hypothetical protein